MHLFLHVLRKLPHPCVAGTLVALALGTVSAQALELVAHRGASHDAPENTLAAFRLAWQQNADAVEGDFHLTKDNHIVCLHDKDAQRVAGVPLSPAESTLSELKALDVGRWKSPDYAEERIPTLPEVLAEVPRGKKILIEVKCGPEIVPFLQRDLREFPLEQAVVIAFDHQVVAAVKHAMPNLKAYWLTGFKKEKPDEEWQPSLSQILQTLRDCQADGLDCQAKEVLDRKFVQTLRQNGFEFHVWTVNDPNVGRRMVELGVDSITTDRPAFLRDQLNLLK